MLRLLLLISTISALIFSIESCKHDPITVGTNPGNNNGGNNPDTTTNSGNPCDPDSVYFQTQILPILVSNCAFSGCHNAASAEDGVVLDNYQNVINTGDIRPFNLDSDLFEVITETDPDDRMPPPPNNPLSQEQINLIRNWISQGAQNNSCSNNSNCNLDNITYTNTIQSIINTSCVGCHNDAVQNGNINLSGYNNLKAVAQGGRLLGAIKQEPGFIAMPQGGQKLSSCSIDQIETWISEGFAN
ncbi:MAG: c-type cytochrome domain-containing protein [Saprospiraceae bacterium]